MGAHFMFSGLVLAEGIGFIIVLDVPVTELKSKLLILINFQNMVSSLKR